MSHRPSLLPGRSKRILPWYTKHHCTTIQLANKKKKKYTFIICDFVTLGRLVEERAKVRKVHTEQVPNPINTRRQIDKRAPGEKGREGGRVCAHELPCRLHTVHTLGTSVPHISPGAQKVFVSKNALSYRTQKVRRSHSSSKQPPLVSFPA